VSFAGVRELEELRLTPITKSKCGQSNQTVSNQLTKNRCYQKFGFAAKNSKCTKKMFLNPEK